MYVVYPVHIDGTPMGKPPRMRHHPDCGHFEWRTGETLGTPVLATPEQMRTLGACDTCVGARDKNSAGSPLGTVCPTCRQVMPLTRICDNCR